MGFQLRCEGSPPYAVPCARPPVDFEAQAGVARRPVCCCWACSIPSFPGHAYRALMLARRAGARCGSCGRHRHGAWSLCHQVATRAALARRGCVDRRRADQSCAFHEVNGCACGCGLCGDLWTVETDRAVWAWRPRLCRPRRQPSVRTQAQLLIGSWCAPSEIRCGFAGMPTCCSGECLAQSRQSAMGAVRGPLPLSHQPPTRPSVAAIQTLLRLTMADSSDIKSHKTFSVGVPK